MSQDGPEQAPSFTYEDVEESFRRFLLSRPKGDARSQRVPVAEGTFKTGYPGPQAQPRPPPPKMKAATKQAQAQKSTAFEGPANDDGPAGGAMAADEEVTEKAAEFEVCFGDLDKAFLEEYLEGALNEKEIDVDDILRNGALPDDVKSEILSRVKKNTGMNARQAERKLEEEFQKWLAAKRVAEEKKRKLEEEARIRNRVPVWKCGACGRPWGVCTFWGPFFSHYDYP